MSSPADFQRETNAPRKMPIQEEKGDTDFWFDVITTPLNACSLETYFPLPRPRDDNDSISFIPLVIGCYQLNESSNLESVEGSSSDAKSPSSVGSNRCGELRLHMIPTPSTSKTEMKFSDATCILQMKSGILDGKWKRRKRNCNEETEQYAQTPLFASACASGSIHLHGLQKNKSAEFTTNTSWCLNHLASSERNSDAGLCLAIAWNDYTNQMEDQIVSSYSEGQVAIHQVSYCNEDANEPTLKETSRWKAHTLFGRPSEVWTCSFLRGAENVVLSGADDCSMKVWDIRQTQRPVHKVGDTEFEAGVTALSSHPSLDNIFAAGSYDEHVRLYDYRKLDKPLSKIFAGGGVWRIKWHPYCCQKVLVAAMHGGCFVIDFPLLNGNGTDANIVSKFTAHESMAYGVDWIAFGSPELEAAGSCSFYDRKAFIWDTYS